jgi:hypothetical protein
MHDSDEVEIVGGAAAGVGCALIVLLSVAVIITLASIIFGASA